MNDFFPLFLTLVAPQPKMQANLRQECTLLDKSPTINSILSRLSHNRKTIEGVEERYILWWLFGVALESCCLALTIDFFVEKVV